MAASVAHTNTPTHPEPSSTDHQHQFPSTMIKQGIVSNPSSHSLSPPPQFEALRSPTLYEMMSLEPKTYPHAQKKLQERISAILSRSPFLNCGKKWGMGDVKLKMVAKVEEGDRNRAGFHVSMDVHRRVLAAKSRFFAGKLRQGGIHSVEILDCDDVEVYVEAIILMYCDDVKAKLMGMEVSKILSLLQVSSDLMFENGISACLEYLEAIPWSEEEEEIVVSYLHQLPLDCARTGDVLQRLRAEPSTSSRADDIFFKLSLGVLQAKNDKARGEMKAFLHRLLKEDPNNITSLNFLDISKDVLYHLCHRCLSSLILYLSEATSLDEIKTDRGNLMAKIAREADNLQWIVGIMIERKMGDEFVQLWADQKELAVLHSKIPAIYRHEISNITAQLCISIGRGHILVPKETRYSLLLTWLEALYDDFGWMGRVRKSIDKKLVEEGLTRTILTLPLPQQQSILLDWFDGFVNRGCDYPNIQRAFETWWRRAFVKQYLIESQLQITVCDVPN